jgi:hypothetical protein
MKDQGWRPPAGPLDAQQTLSVTCCSHGERLQVAADPMAELPFAMFDAQDDLMQQIIAKRLPQVAGQGKIALLGGIQINTRAVFLTTFYLFDLIS